MSSTWGFFALLSACLLVTVTALNCYSCQNCAQTVTNLRQTSRVCPVGLMGMAQPQCFHEITTTGVVNRGCTNRSECSARFSQRMERQCDPGVQPPCYSCCDMDNCNKGTNGAAMTTVSMTTVMLLLIPTALSMLISW